MTKCQFDIYLQIKNITEMQHTYMTKSHTK